MSHLVGNPEDRFAHVTAHMSVALRSSNSCVSNYFQNHTYIYFYLLSDLQGDKFFRPKKVRQIRAPKYKLLTNTEVATEQEAFVRWALQMLQMPPVMNPRQEIEQIISKDPDIADVLPTKFVFVDISMHIKDRVSLL